MENDSLKDIGALVSSSPQILSLSHVVDASVCEAEVVFPAVKTGLLKGTEIFRHHEAQSSAIIALRYSFLILAIYLLWRFVRFTLRPTSVAGRDEPQEVPYSIPFIGHAASFLTDYGSTITYGRKYFNNRRPFFLQSGPAKPLFITNALDAARMHRDAATFNHYGFLKGLVATIGVSEKSSKTLWDTPNMKPADIDPNDPFSGKPLATRLLTTLRQQLAPDGSPDNLHDRFIKANLEYVQWDRIRETTQSTKRSDGRQHVSLAYWTRYALGIGATKAMFGDAIFKVQPDFLDLLFDFDDKSWMLICEVPKPFSNKMYQRIEQTKHAIEKYFQLPKEERADACYLVNKLEEDTLTAGISAGDLAAYILVTFWGTTTNAWKMCFWLLGHMALDKQLLALMRQELDPVVKDFEQGTTSTTEFGNALKDCPQWLSFYQEVMRMTGSSGSVRHTTKPTEFAGYSLQTGTKMIVPYREMFTDAIVFGNDSDTFRWDRFMGPKGRALARSQSYKPFGGGVGLCPGRFLSQAEIMTFVALIVGRYDLDVIGRSSLPPLETKKPSLGIMGASNGQDIVVSVRNRD